MAKIERQGEKVMKKASLGRKKIQVMNFPTPRLGSDFDSFQESFRLRIQGSGSRLLHISENFPDSESGLRLLTPDPTPFRNVLTHDSYTFEKFS